MNASFPLRLLCHPATPDAAIRRAEVSVAPTPDGGLTLSFEVEAEPDCLILPAPVAATETATDGLWRHTCCEAFVGRAGCPAYREFNFSPSGAWASYAFADTRQRDEAAEAGWRKPPPAAFFGRAGGFLLRAVLPAEQLPAGPGALQLGLSMVLETAPGGCSYWALAHPAPQPDFHHRAAFALSLN